MKVNSELTMNFKRYKNQCCQEIQVFFEKKSIDMGLVHSNLQSLTATIKDCCSIIQAGWRDSVSIATLVNILGHYILEEVVGESILKV